MVVAANWEDYTLNHFDANFDRPQVTEAICNTFSAELAHRRARPLIQTTVCVSWRANTRSNSLVRCASAPIALMVMSIAEYNSRFKSAHMAETCSGLPPKCARALVFASCSSLLFFLDEHPVDC